METTFKTSEAILKFLQENPATELNPWEGATMNSRGWMIRFKDKSQLPLKCDGRAAKAAWKTLHHPP